MFYGLPLFIFSLPVNYKVNKFQPYSPVPFSQSTELVTEWKTLVNTPLYW